MSRPIFIGRRTRAVVSHISGTEGAAPSKTNMGMHVRKAIFIRSASDDGYRFARARNVNARLIDTDSVGETSDEVSINEPLMSQ